MEVSTVATEERRADTRLDAISQARVQRRNPLFASCVWHGALRNGSRGGACLHVNTPLDLGEWIDLKLDSGVIPFVTAGQKTIEARVVRQIASNDAVVHGVSGYTFGVEFKRNIKLRMAHAWYRSIPWLVGALFIAGVVNVGYLKSFNFDSFWYQPLLNFYSILISIFILSRVVLALFYRPPKNLGYQPTVTAIIACKNEEDSIAKTIDVIFNSNYPRARLEVVAVNDGSTDRTLEEMRAAQRRNPQLKIIDFKKNLGKRHGMAAGARAAKGEILVYIDSDSFVRPDTIHKLVQGFADRDVGAVCGHAHVQNARTNLLTKMQEVRYYIAFRIVKAAESLFSSVSCCSGCLAAYRKEYVMPVLDHWLHQTFLGEIATFGDDRSLTNYMLRRYRVIYDSEAVCTTIVPETYRVFFRQQLRWKKSWIRESLIACTFIWRKHPTAAISYYLGVLFPFVGPLVVLNALALPLLGAASPSLSYLYGAILMSFLYSLVYLARFRNTLWIYGVYFTFFYMFVLAWQTFYALLTVRRNHWGTR